MLTSNNQYLRPEYLTPLPTTLDAKKSPLALLAQTCSQIGADSSNSKLLQNSEKSNKIGKSEITRDKAALNNSDGAPKPNLKTDSVIREQSKTPEEKTIISSCSNSDIRTPVTSKSSSSGRSSNQSLNSPRGSPLSLERRTPIVEGNGEMCTTPEKNTEINNPKSPSSCSPKTAFTPNILTSSSDPSIKDLPLGTFKPGVSSSSSAFIGYPSTGFSMPIDMMSNSLVSHHALKSANLNPYLGYGRIKTAESLSSVCRDPYCTGCSVSSHLMGVPSAIKTSSCPAGCVQCDHVKSTSSGFMGQTSAAAAYAHAQLAALAAASHLPFICNWISSDTSYCGKRFPSSDELLSHLRTHTSGTLSETNTISILNSSGLPPTHPLLHRTYPTPPLSPLATPRYHPYSKPSLLHPTLSSSLSGFPLSHPNLSPYLSSYSLYGPRIGTAPGMHP